MYYLLNNNEEALIRRIYYSESATYGMKLMTYRLFIVSSLALSTMSLNVTCNDS